MARKPSTKKRVETNEPLTFSQFITQPGEQQDAYQEPGSEGTSTTKKSAEDQLTELRAMLDKQQRDMEDLRRTNTALMTAPHVEVAAVAPKAPTLDLSGLPDPVYEKEAYQAGLQERIAKHTQALFQYDEEKRNASQRNNEQTTERYNSLWEDFSKDERFGVYAKEADDDDLQHAINTTVTAARRRGLDLDRYMFATRDQFFADVAKTYDKKFGKPGEDNDTDGEIDLSEPVGRTVVFGGTDGSPRGRSGDTGVQQGDMVKEIQELQRKSGLF